MSGIPLRLPLYSLDYLENDRLEPMHKLVSLSTSVEIGTKTIITWEKRCEYMNGSQTARRSRTGEIEELFHLHPSLRNRIHSESPSRLSPAPPLPCNEDGNPGNPGNNTTTSSVQPPSYDDNQQSLNSINGGVPLEPGNVMEQ
ncbi:unnamed protein product [Rhizophagus irregularis]|uniref:Uncharacterized protein n=1 Tax=Rhizophagus irregularis TaxID=588596 RepID=A0A915Z9Y1_9GLOM|nr:unnamed protein product [Rhizophagus irregularis]CAB5366501.1 unnamed protein product [Rhizophagus irregularis]